MAFCPPPNHRPEEPRHRKLNLRQNQRQRMSNSEPVFFSPDCRLTSPRARMGWFSLSLITPLQASKPSQVAQRSGTSAGNTFETLVQESQLQARPGWSYPISMSGETRSYSCRRVLFWHRHSGRAPMLGLPGLEGDQTATPGAVAMLCMNRHNQLELVDENTMRDARYVICFTFSFDMCCCSALQSSALRMQVIVHPQHRALCLQARPASAASFQESTRGSGTRLSAEPQLQRWDLQP